MSEPIVFVSHFYVKEGKLDALKDLARVVTERIDLEKPRTLLYLSYIDEAGGTISFVHAFADADSMDLHVEGADQRSAAAYEHVQPAGWEVYGSPSDAAIDSLRTAAAKFGVTITEQPDLVAGFLRLARE